MEGEEVEAEAKHGGGQEKMKQSKNEMPSIAMQISYSFEYSNLPMKMYYIH